MLKAFSYMFKDNMFIKKALLYGLFLLITNLFTQIGQTFAPLDKNTPAPLIYYVLTLLGFIALFIPTGYGMACIKAIREQDDNIVLPFINLKHNFAAGFKLMFGIILLSIASGIIYIVSLIIPAIVLAIFNMKAVMTIIMAIISLAVLILITVYSPAFCCIFSEKEWVTTFFRFIRATKLIKENVGNYFKYVGLFVVFMIAVSFVNSLIMIIFNGSIIGAVIVSLLLALISVYTGFVFMYIAAKSLTAKNIE